MEINKRVLLIIDPQNDFVTGSLPVPGATEAMERLAQWMRAHRADYDTVVITMDQHPLDHCSFKAQGGIWPAHCIRYSVGAALYPAVQSAVEELSAEGKSIVYIEKAISADRDEYSAFGQTIPQVLLEAECIWLAGLAGDYCVATSESDLLRAIPRERILRLEEGIAYITPPMP